MIYQDSASKRWGNTLLNFLKWIYGLGEKEIGKSYLIRNNV